MEARDAALLAEHLNQSAEALPGPAYYRVLKWIHQDLEPTNYVEIGVNRGISLVQALPGTTCIGIDPTPDLHPDVKDQPVVVESLIFSLTSDDFFAENDLPELLGGPVSLAFIDGLHLFEQVLQDFINLERESDEDTIILLHDTIPLDEVTASRERTTDFYCGDVWKATLAIRRLRPELEMVTVRTAPTGLSLVRGLDRSNRELERNFDEIVAEYRDLDFGYFEAHRDEMPDEIENEPEAVKAWLQGSRT